MTENYLYKYKSKLLRKGSTNTDTENLVFCKYLAFSQSFDDTIDTPYYMTLSIQYNPEAALQKYS